MKEGKLDGKIQRKWNLLESAGNKNKTVNKREQSKKDRTENIIENIIYKSK